MKKLLLILLCVPLIGMSQTREISMNLFAVSATQMNVLYANDIENPIQVSVAGYQPQDIKVSFSGGVLTSVNRKKGEYIIKPSQSNVGKEVSVSVSVKKKDGKTQSIGKLNN